MVPTSQGFSRAGRHEKLLIPVQTRNWMLAYHTGVMPNLAHTGCVRGNPNLFTQGKEI